VAWASPRSARGARLLNLISDLDPDVAILTEVTIPFLESTKQNFATSIQDYGYPHKGERRKVAIVSGKCVTNIDSVGNERLPPGRFISCRSHGLNIVGTCVPWAHAHVSTGRKDRAPWADHVTYLRTLHTLDLLTSKQLLVGGDLNQRIPRVRNPELAWETLISTFGHLQCATSGPLPPEGEKAIDYLFCSTDMDTHAVRTISKNYDQIKLSDHVGVVGTLSLRSQQDQPNT